MKRIVLVSLLWGHSTLATAQNQVNVDELNNLEEGFENNELQLEEEGNDKLQSQNGKLNTSENSQETNLNLNLEENIQQQENANLNSANTVNNPGDDELLENNINSGQNFDQNLNTSADQINPSQDSASSDLNNNTSLNNNLGNIEPPINDESLGTLLDNTAQNDNFNSENATTEGKNTALNPVQDDIFLQNDLTPANEIPQTDGSPLNNTELIDQPANFILDLNSQQNQGALQAPVEPDVEMLTDPSPPSQTVLNMVQEPNLFSGAPPIPGSLRNLIEGEAPEEYGVELGDTLYDICDQLLDEAGYWPKLWALNPYITNPHFIYPGMRLRFFSGDAVTPPFLQVITEDEVVPVDTAEIRREEILQQDISKLLTRAERPDRTPVVLPEEMEEFPEIDEAFLRQGDIFSSDNFSVILPAFIFASKKKPLATIVGGTAGSFLMDQGQDIIMQAEDTSEDLRGTLSVLRFSQEVYHPQDDRLVGYRYEFIGHIGSFKLIDPDEQLVAGKVIFSRLGLRPGDIVTSFTSVKRQVPHTFSSRSIGNQTVIGFDYPESRMGGRGSFVLLDRNANDSLKAGTTVRIFQNVRQNAGIFSNSILPDFKKFVAEAYILDKSDRATIAYIIHDRFEVKIGDKTNL